MCLFQVLSQRSLRPELVLGRTVCQSFKQTLINPEPHRMNPPIVPKQYQGTIIFTNSGMPAPSTSKTALPVMPFVTELPNCPDLCFNDILNSPLGCLDPILSVYGTATKIDMPKSPMLPAASPLSALASPFSNILPTMPPCDRDSHFLTRVPIPPPFI